LKLVLEFDVLTHTGDEPPRQVDTAIQQRISVVASGRVDAFATQLARAIEADMLLGARLRGYRVWTAHNGHIEPLFANAVTGEDFRLTTRADEE
jgi:hypothetical protein